MVGRRELGESVGCPSLSVHSSPHTACSRCLIRFCSSILLSAAHFLLFLASTVAGNMAGQPKFQPHKLSANTVNTHRSDCTRRTGWSTRALEQQRQSGQRYRPGHWQSNSSVYMPREISVKELFSLSPLSLLLTGHSDIVLAGEYKLKSASVI